MQTTKSNRIFVHGNVYELVKSIGTDDSVTDVQDILDELKTAQKEFDDAVARIAGIVESYDDIVVLASPILALKPAKGKIYVKISGMLKQYESDKVSAYLYKIEMARWQFIDTLVQTAYHLAYQSFYNAAGDFNLEQTEKALDITNGIKMLKSEHSEGYKKANNTSRFHKYTMAGSDEPTRVTAPAEKPELRLDQKIVKWLQLSIKQALVAAQLLADATLDSLGNYDKAISAIDEVKKTLKEVAKYPAVTAKPAPPKPPEPTEDSDATVSAEKAKEMGTEPTAIDPRVKRSSTEIMYRNARYRKVKSV
jgi:hypothetical protein